MLFFFYQQRRFKTYCLLLHSRMLSSQMAIDQKMSDGGELSSIRRSPINEVDETTVKDAKASSSGVSRSVSDRYSYHAAIYEQPLNNSNY